MCVQTTKCVYRRQNVCTDHKMCVQTTKPDDELPNDVDTEMATSKLKNGK